MPAVSITASSAKAFVVRAGKFAYGVKNTSDTTVYLRHMQTVAVSGDDMGIPLEPGELRIMSFEHRLDKDLTVMGIHGGSGSKTVVYEEYAVPVKSVAGVNSTANVTLSAGDVEIGAVELKNAADDTRAKVVAASTEAAAADAALVTAQRPSEVVLGKTVGVSTIVTSAVVFTDTNARATGDYCGTDTTPQSFASAVRVSGGTGVIKSVRITDYTTTAAVDMELWLFSATFTAPADNAAWTVSDAEALTCLGVIPLPADKWYASGANKVFSDDTLGLVIKPAATSLFYALVARGTTPAWTTAAGLQLALGILQD